jgi:hypothetical protein
LAETTAGWNLLAGLPLLAYSAARHMSAKKCIAVGCEFDRLAPPIMNFWQGSHAKSKT